MELRVLRYFLAVAREGGISAAANFLHLTQPTLSRQIMDLEEKLGCKLLKRGSNGTKLTDEGFLLKKRAEEILDMAERTREELSHNDDISGSIYIGGGETVAMREIAGIVGSMQRKYPKIRYHLYSGNAEDVTEKLDKGLLDFGLLIQPSELSKYEHITLRNKDSWGLIMRKDDPLASKAKIKKRDLLGSPLLVSRRQIAMSNDDPLIMWLGGILDECNIVSTYNLIYNAGIMVAEGIGRALALDNLVDTSRQSELCFRPLSPKVETKVNVVWKKDRYFSKPAKLFLESLKSYLKI